jgi:uncharacterized protein YndB with AHSA1/START domain
VADPRHKVHLTAEVAAPRDDVFDYLTAHFDELWQGRMEHVRPAHEGSDPLGHGFVRRMHTPVGKLDEEIVTHDRPSLIEYTIINDHDTPLYNHLGRMELSEDGSGGTKLDYTIAFDHRPAWRGHLTAGALHLGWMIRGRRRLAKRFGG